jgi:hypothetical protein
MSVIIIADLLTVLMSTQAHTFVCCLHCVSPSIYLNAV